MHINHPIPLITCYSRVYSHLLGIYSMHVSLLPVAVNDSVYWKKVLSTRMISPLSETVQSDQYWSSLSPYCNITSWHFLLIVMATDSIVFHWMWTTHKHMHRELKGMENKRMGRMEKKHTVGLEPTISCSVGKRLIQLGYACLHFTSDYCK